MPVRKIPKNYRNVTGIVASSKSGGAAQFESTLERDFLALLEFSPEVTNIDPQPVKIEWVDANGCQRSYTPDVLVEFSESDGKPPWLCEVMSDGQLCLNDFRVIREEEKQPFTPGRSIELHEKSLAWLKAKLDEPFDGKTVVVKHHLPSRLSVVDRFKDSLLSACFASELDFLFGKMDVWIHGHTHDNLDYEANGTHVICNPRGYVTYRGQENFYFKPGLVIEV